jgi:hypothetical protein
MAKQHRMFVLTLATLWSAAEAALGVPLRGLRIGLAAIVCGAIATVWRRIALIAKEVQAP